jgi:hypothetical protein
MLRITQLRDVGNVILYLFSLWTFRLYRRPLSFLRTSISLYPVTWRQIIRRSWSEPSVGLGFILSQKWNAMSWGEGGLCQSISEEIVLKYQFPEWKLSKSLNIYLDFKICKCRAGQTHGSVMSPKGNNRLWLASVVLGGFLVRNVYIFKSLQAIK